MNPESHLPQPSPESGSGVTPQIVQESGCGILPQSVQGASCSDFISPVSSPAPHPHVQFHHPYSCADMGFVYPPEMPAEPDYDDGYDDAREHELLMHDLADDNDDFARSDEEGWYYSDED